MYRTCISANSTCTLSLNVVRDSVWHKFQCPQTDRLNTAEPANPAFELPARSDAFRPPFTFVRLAIYHGYMVNQRSIGEVFFSLVVVITVLVTGCGKKESDLRFGRSEEGKSAVAPPVAVTDNATSTRVATVNIDSLTKVANDDLLSNGWESEVVSENVSTQLKHLGDVWSRRDDSAYSMTEIVADQCETEAIRPAQLHVSYLDEYTTVRRLGEDLQRPATAVSPEQLKASLYHVLRDLNIVRDTRTQFKVFDVQLNQTRSTTGVHVQLSGASETAHVQMNATWFCDWNNIDSDEPKLSGLRITRYEEVVIAGGSEPAFIDKTTSVLNGHVFRDQLRHGADYWLERIPSAMGIDIGGWQGLAIGDVNGDGLDDLYICQPGGLPNRLYVQNTDATATETSASAGVDWIESSHGALIVDFDNDGDQDLAIGVESGLLLMANDGHGKFDVRAAKVLPAALPYSISAADYDGDGDLDLFVSCYNRRRGVNHHITLARPIPYHDANNGGRNVLLRNDRTPKNGKWLFGYATGTTGLDAMNNRRYSFAAAWEDYDNDGDLDVYIANDFGRNNLYRNENGTFTDVAEQANVEDIGAGMSACWGDYDNDGLMDLYVSNMFSSAGNRITGQSNFQESADQQTRGAFRRHARGNSLFHNLGNGEFEDVSLENGVDLGRWAWGSRFVDINNDGWQDLLVANGFITQEDTGDL